MAVIPKTYLYQVWASDGVTYLGILQNVSSDFEYNQTINTAGVQIEIEVGASPDTAGLPVDLITDETGIPITDESTNTLTTEAALELVGGANPKALIQNNNYLKVTEFSQFYPNGVVVFYGYISKWKAIFGGSDNIKITAISHGQDMNNYLVSSGDTNWITQTTDNSTTHTMGNGSGAVGSQFDNMVLQEFTATSAVPVGGASFEIANTTAGQYYLTIYQRSGTTPNPATDVVVAYGSASVPIISVKTVQKISAVSSTNLTNGQVYYMLLSWASSTGTPNSATVYTNSTKPYASGNFYTVAQSNNDDSYALTLVSESAYFVIFQHGNSVIAEYDGVDPTYMLNDIMTSYHGNGGLVSMAALNYTGVSTSYVFKVQTILQAINTIQQNLAPANWYWYVDPATSKLYFNQPNTVADVTIIKGKHIESLELEATKENIKNSVYFTGGDDGTGTSTNIFTKTTAATNGNRVGLAQLTDNRVKATGSITKANAITIAQTISQGYINENSAETYITTIEIQDSTMDTTLLSLGKVLGFAGFGTMIDSLLLLVVGVHKQPDKVTLQLGSLPTRASSAVATIQTQLAYQQTINNPSSPS